MRRGVDAVREQVRALPTTPPKWRKKRYRVGEIACGAYARMAIGSADGHGRGVGDMHERQRGVGQAIALAGARERSIGVDPYAGLLVSPAIDVMQMLFSP